MRKSPPAGALAAVLMLVSAAAAQEKFIDVRQAMADDLTAVKAAAARSEWDAAAGSFEKGRSLWLNEVKPMIVSGAKGDPQFSEYFDRIGDVEADLDRVVLSLKNRDAGGAESAVNAVIWGISHHPRGFDVPAARYTVWDWVFGLGIGVGFCVFAVLFGLHLRRSYYRRYKKQAGPGE
ncbi:MAG TPA: hypothetical protein PLX50_00465 [Candidatus Aminicenantes bacterium]|nr:hypothetical protein [Candidatus Aminicenantes bacterium]